MNLKLAARIIRTGAVLLAVVTLTACSVSFTTSHLSSLSVSKDKDGTTAASSFGPHDTIYAKGTVANVSGTVTLKWRLIAEKVQGQTDNFAIPGLDKSFELPSDGSSTYDLSAPDAGWPPGTYKIELHMLVEGGEEKDLKTAEFTVAGS